MAFYSTFWPLEKWSWFYNSHVIIENIFSPFLGEFIKWLFIKKWMQIESEKSSIQYMPAALFVYHYKEGFAILFQSRIRLYPTDSNSILQWKARPAARKTDKLSLNATLYLN